MASGTSRMYSAGSFPRLTGEYGAGICDVLPILNEEEPLTIRLFYPTSKKAHEVAQTELYHPSSSNVYRYRKALILAHEIVPTLFAAPMAYISSHFSNSQLPAILHAPLLEGKKFPIVVFSHGLTGCRSGFSCIQCDLASHGYIVAAVEHKDGSACLSYTKTKSENTQGGEPVYEDKWIEFTSSNLTALPLRYNQVRAQVAFGIQ
jgi:platelet-activating factor acetylhydrolase